MDISKANGEEWSFLEGYSSLEPALQLKSNPDDSWLTKMWRKWKVIIQPFVNYPFRWKLINLS